MAHLVHVRKFVFTSSAEVPYHYVCGKCGKEVNGTIKLAGISQISHESNVPNSPYLNQLSDDEKQTHTALAEKNLESRIKESKRLTDTGDYVTFKKECPYCGSLQHWDNNLKKVILYVGGTLLLFLCGILFVVISLMTMNDPEGLGLKGLIIAGVSLFAAFGVGYNAVKKWKGYRATKGQDTHKPVIEYDRLINRKMTIK